MTTKFIHSVKVPRLYKESAKVIKTILVDGTSFKSVVFKANHPNVQGIYGLVSEALQHDYELQCLIHETNILIENPQFDPYLARILITELLWGKKKITSQAKPILTVLKYKEKLEQTLMQISDATVDPCDKKKAKLPRYVRVNTILTSIDEALQAFYDDGWILLPKCANYSSYLETVSNLESENFIQDFHIPEVFVFPPGTKFHDHPGILNGKLLMQDKATCLTAFLLNPKPGSEIMDMCAAPGMKTTHLAAMINNTGKIYAVEMNKNRYDTLCDFVTHTKAKCVKTINADVLSLRSEMYPDVKYIVVDPSCSGSGMDRYEIKKPDEEDLYCRLRKLRDLQVTILKHAVGHFPNVKKVIYSTCSIYKEENESVVSEVLQKCGHRFKLVNLKKKLNYEWLNSGSFEYGFNGNKCLYALPERDLCKGFFVAMFKRRTKKNLTDAPELENNLPMLKDGASQNDFDEDSDIQEIKYNDDCNNFSKAKKRKNESVALSNEGQIEINDSSEVTVEKKKKKKKKDKLDPETQ